MDIKLCLFQNWNGFSNMKIYSVFLK